MMETDIAVGSGLKVTCDRDQLVAALATVSRVVSSRGSVQVLSGVLLRPEGDSLELAATDMELSLRTTLTAQVEGDSAVVVPGKLLVDLARLLPAADVTLEYRPEEGVAHISTAATPRSSTFSPRRTFHDFRPSTSLPTRSQRPRCSKRSIGLRDRRRKTSRDPS